MNELPVLNGTAAKFLRKSFERIRGIIPFALGVFAAFAGLLLYNAFFPAKQLSRRDVDKAIANAMASATPRPSYAVQVYQKIQPSIVWIEAKFTDAEGGEQKRLGTGVIIDDYGDILTSLHVVGSSTDIFVTFSDGFEARAFVLDATPEKDIVVLRTFNTPTYLVPATLGNPGSMRVGDDIYIVGNPFGLYGSMSSGIISAFDRVFQPIGTDQTIEGLIQFDAAANPGNSGGPLLDRRGHVIGIVTGLINPTQDNFFIGIGFAVPITTAVTGGAGSPPY